MQLKGDSCEYTEKDTIYDNDSPFNGYCDFDSNCYAFQDCHSTCFLYFGEPHRYFYSHVLVALDGSFVILASSFGFLMAGYPMVIVFRAFSHISFGALGALYLQKFPIP